MSIGGKERPICGITCAGTDPLLYGIHRKIPPDFPAVFFARLRIIPKPVKKIEKLFIAPKVRQVLYETSQRVFTRCACAQRTGFLIKFFNQESVSGRLGQILRKLWQSVHWSMEG